MCIQTITSYACKHISTAYNTTTPHCSATSICTLPSPLPARNVKSSLLCANCLSKKVERDVNQMRELEHFARIRGGEVKVVGEKEKVVEIEAKSVRVIAKGLEEAGHVTEGLLKKAGKVIEGSTHSGFKEKGEIEVGKIFWVFH
ncbi:hypothetical protein B9Z19DRAFT_1109062 [Tuber borchii]|uniref:Uncharacterized protein n=1 Tax=Tuber borchii TaxID=42251 RepID=A0A2T6ZNS4_TUBBO|nr:hypothetical protein B9Z19DRAFT_1109062 [Tuber borchii]